MLHEPVKVAYQHFIAGQTFKAEAICLEVLRQAPRDAAATHVLALIAQRQGRLGPALRLAEMAAEAAPALPEYHNTHGTILADLKRYDHAVEAFERALQLRPKYPHALYNMGLSLIQAKRPEQSVEILQHALSLSPNDPKVLCRLGSALRHAGRLTAAIKHFHAALRISPSFSQAWSGLAGVTGDLAQAEQAANWEHRVVEARADAPGPYSDWLFTLLHVDGIGPKDLYAAHCGWAERFGPQAERDLARGPDAMDLHRPLRVGYVSPDFRRHPVSAFIAPVLASHSPSVEVFCYSDVKTPDDMTRRIRSFRCEWRDVAGVPDEQLRDIIHADRIDILVDLAGHGADNRLLMFTHRLAPVQVTYLGYPATTGLSTIQYRLTDEHHDPFNLTDRYHTEALVRLPEGCWCWRPDDCMPEVNTPPALGGGGITFGVLNRSIKWNDRMMRLWARVLSSVPGSRLLMLAPRGAEADAGLMDRLTSHRILPAKLTLVGRTSRRRYLELFAETDISLDTFPYAGHTTTCDSLWMGVPVVTLAGETHVARAGVSVLTTVDLPELIARTEEEYAEKAIALAGDLPRLAAMRRGLRGRMLASPLCDGVGFARKLEAAYREMWGAWCEGREALS